MDKRYEERSHNMVQNWDIWNDTGRAAEIRAKMSASHKARWEKNRERYVAANQVGAAKKRGKKYKQNAKKASKSALYNQFGIRYHSIEHAALKLGLHERLIRLVLEGKRKHTGGYQFQLASVRFEDYRNRRAA